MSSIKTIFIELICEEYEFIVISPKKRTFEWNIIFKSYSYISEFDFQEK